MGIQVEYCYGVEDSYQVSCSPGDILRDDIGEMSGVTVAFNSKGKLFACKKLRRPENEQQTAQFRFDAQENEARILSELKHDHIVAFHDICLSEGYMILEWCQYHHLTSDHIRRTQPNLREDLLALSFQMVDALTFLHHQGGIVHFDVHPENILVTTLAPRLTCKLANFSRAVRKSNFEFKGLKVRAERRHIPPELRDDCDIPTDVSLADKCDVWSLGWTLAGMALAGSIPANDGDVMMKLGETFGLNPNSRTQIPDTFCVMVSGMLDQNPSTRYSTEKCLWFLRPEIPSNSWLHNKTKKLALSRFDAMDFSGYYAAGSLLGHNPQAVVPFIMPTPEKLPESNNGVTNGQDDTDLDEGWSENAQWKPKSDIQEKQSVVEPKYEKKKNKSGEKSQRHVRFETHHNEGEGQARNQSPKHNLGKKQDKNQKENSGPDRVQSQRKNPDQTKDQRQDQNQKFGRNQDQRQKQNKNPSPNTRNQPRNTSPTRRPGSGGNGEKAKSGNQGQATIQIPKDKGTKYRESDEKGAGGGASMIEVTIE
ncbi:kinase-like domain-containing protein [Lasiosphaeria ovina]|uniref:Kinase-like domain-containing protein n=1 Tax=Lasiosphaeria ovina TaxID=92902 RepID=A0AAE0JZX2_9PEZI|nr:kinase-like domain-containing protein [Lasiosphaeria ovina]